MESKDMSKAKAVSTNRVKKSREDWIFDIILYTIGVLLIIITLYPMYFIVIGHGELAGILAPGSDLVSAGGIAEEQIGRAHV